MVEKLPKVKRSIPGASDRLYGSLTLHWLSSRRPVGFDQCVVSARNVASRFKPRLIAYGDSKLAVSQGRKTPEIRSF